MRIDVSLIGVDRLPVWGGLGEVRHRAVVVEEGLIRRQGQTSGHDGRRQSLSVFVKGYCLADDLDRLVERGAGGSPVNPPVDGREGYGEEVQRHAEQHVRVPRLRSDEDGDDPIDGDLVRDERRQPRRAREGHQRAAGSRHTLTLFDGDELLDAIPVPVSAT